MRFYNVFNYKTKYSNVDNAVGGGGEKQPLSKEACFITDMLHNAHNSNTMPVIGSSSQ
jgi:hypothetical protein